MSTQTAVFDELLEPIIHCLNADSAKRIVELRASPAAQARIEELAAKCSNGLLTEPERAEYEACISASNFVAILQSKARKIIQRGG